MKQKKLMYRKMRVLIVKADKVTAETKEIDVQENEIRTIY